MHIDVGNIAWGLLTASLLIGWGLALGRNRAAQERRYAQQAREDPGRAERSRRRAFWLWVLFG